MHHSRLAGFIIDCPTDDLPKATDFWSAALGMPPADPHGPYIRLDAGPRDLTIEVQRVDHAARLHLDIEADDVEVEVRRLERLGAKRVQQIKSWWVLESPTGQRFCVVKSPDVATLSGANR